MEIKEAIERLNGRVGVAEWANLDYVDLVEINDLKLAISALEKQIGKKPDLKPKPLKNEVFWWQCPHCQAHNHTNTMHNYCHHCGQKIDWSEVD